MLSQHFIYFYNTGIIDSLIKDIKSDNLYFIIPVWDKHCSEIFLNGKGNLSGGRIYAYMQRNDLEVQYLKLRFNDSESIKESLYRIIHHIEIRPKCPICGNPISFSKDDGFRKHCSSKCSANDPETRKICADTCMKRLGVSNPFQSKELQEKWKENNIKKYGTPHACMTEDVKKRRMETNLRKYGCPYASQAKEIRDKTTKTIIKKFGVDNVSKSDLIKKKKEKTCIEHFGFKSNLQNEKQKEKIRNTNIRKYGVPNTYQIEFVKAKTRYLRVRHSNPENKLYDILSDSFGKDNVLREYRSTVYPFFSDFYISNLNLYIEYQGYWTHGKHQYTGSPADMTILETWKSRTHISSMYITAIKSWSIQDPEKRLTASKNNLRYLEIFPGFPLDEIPAFIEKEFSDLSVVKQLTIGEK